VLSCLGVTDKVILSDPKSMPVAFHVEGFRLLVLEASTVHVSDAYKMMNKSSVW